MSQQPTPESGYYDLPRNECCTHPSHEPPMHLYIPPGKGYRHVCPSCGQVSYMTGNGISLGAVVKKEEEA